MISPDAQFISICELENEGEEYIARRSITDFHKLESIVARIFRPGVSTSTLGLTIFDQATSCIISERAWNSDAFWPVHSSELRLKVSLHEKQRDDSPIQQFPEKTTGESSSELRAAFAFVDEVQAAGDGCSDRQKMNTRLLDHDDEQSVRSVRSQSRTLSPLNFARKTPPLHHPGIVNTNFDNDEPDIPNDDQELPRVDRMDWARTSPSPPPSDEDLPSLSVLLSSSTKTQSSPLFAERLREEASTAKTPSHISTTAPITDEHSSPSSPSVSEISIPYIPFSEPVQSRAPKAKPPNSPSSPRRTPQKRIEEPVGRLRTPFHAINHPHRVLFCMTPQRKWFKLDTTDEHGNKLSKSPGKRGIKASNIEFLPPYHNANLLIEDADQVKAHLVNIIEQNARPSKATHMSSPHVRRKGKEKVRVSQNTSKTWISEIRGSKGMRAPIPCSSCKEDQTEEDCRVYKPGVQGVVTGCAPCLSSKLNCSLEGKSFAP